MKKRTKLFIAVGAVFTVLMAFCLTVSAYGYIDDNRVNNASFIGGGLSVGGVIQTYDYTFQDENGYFDVTLLLPSYSNLNTLFESNEFLTSSQSGYDYINYQTSGYFDYLQVSTNRYSNLNTFRDYLNNLGSYYRNNYNTIIGKDNIITSLNTNLDSLNYQLESLQNDFQSLSNRYDTLTLENTLLSQDNSLLTQENENLNTLLENAVNDNEIAYNNGLNAGLEMGDTIQRGFNEFFNAPFYILKEMFNFEIFGINFYSILKFILTMCVTSFVVKTFV